MFIPAPQAVSRPAIGAAPRFEAKKPPAIDLSLSPALDWDMNLSREVASFLTARIEDAAKLPPPHAFPKSRTLRGPTMVSSSR
jgi:hypothetical protein